MQNLVTSTDYIVCLALETTASQSNIRRLFADGDRLSQLSGGAKQESAPIIGDLAGWAAQNGAVQPRIVHMDWCVCAVKDFKVLESKHVYVNPGVELDAASAAQTRLTADVIKSQGVPFPEALNQVSQGMADEKDFGLVMPNCSDVANSDALFNSFHRWSSRSSLLPAQASTASAPSETGQFATSWLLRRSAVVSPSLRPSQGTM